MSKANKIRQLDKKILKLELECEKLMLENISLKKDKYNQSLTNKVTIQELEGLRLDHEPSLLRNQAE